MPDVTTQMEQALQWAREALAGERVRLRELRDADLPTLVRWWRDPEVAVFNHRVLPRPDGPVEEQFRAWSTNDSAMGAGFCVETPDGELIGHVALFGADAGNRCATFGIVIGPEHQSKGYGTEATRLMADFGFLQLGLHRIELQVDADNARGISAYRTAGFVQEGLLREKLFYAGRFHDQVVMARLAPPPPPSGGGVSG